MSCSAIIIIVLTLILNIANITWYVFQWKCFGCEQNYWILIVSGVVGFLFSYLIWVPNTRKDASIFTGALVTLYIFYLQWSALASLSNPECNPFINSISNTVF